MQTKPTPGTHVSIDTERVLLPVSLGKRCVSLEWETLDQQCCGIMIQTSEACDIEQENQLHHRLAYFHQKVQASLLKGRIRQPMSKNNLRRMFKDDDESGLLWENMLNKKKSTYFSKPFPAVSPQPPGKPVPRFTKVMTPFHGMVNWYTMT